MRVLIFTEMKTTEIYPVNKMVTELKNQGVTCEVVAVCENSQARVSGIDCEVHHIVSSGPFDLKAGYRFFRICGAFRPDIVQTLGQIPLGWVLFSLLFRPFCKMVSLLPSGDNSLKSLFFYNLFVFPFSDHIVAESDALLEMTCVSAERRTLISSNNSEDVRVAGQSPNSNYMAQYLDVYRDLTETTGLRGKLIFSLTPTH